MRTECILKSYSVPVPPNAVFQRVLLATCLVFPISRISYGQDESNLLINLFKGTLIEMLVFRFFSLKAKYSREVMLEELK